MIAHFYVSLLFDFYQGMRLESCSKKYIFILGQTFFSKWLEFNFFRSDTYVVYGSQFWVVSSTFTLGLTNHVNILIFFRYILIFLYVIMMMDKGFEDVFWYNYSLENIFSQIIFFGPKKEHTMAKKCTCWSLLKAKFYCATISFSIDWNQMESIYKQLSSKHIIIIL